MNLKAYAKRQWAWSRAMFFSRRTSDILVTKTNARTKINPIRFTKTKTRTRTKF